MYLFNDTHLNKIKWHTYAINSCRVHKFWLKSKEDHDSALANVGDAESPIPPDDDESDSNNSPSVFVALLASVMNIATNHDVVKDLIPNAINSSKTNMRLLVPLCKIALKLAFYSWLSFSKISIYLILLSIYFYTLYYTYKGNIRSARKQPYRRKDNGRPPAPFFVSIWTQ